MAGYVYVSDIFFSLHMGVIEVIGVIEDNATISCMFCSHLFWFKFRVLIAEVKIDELIKVGWFTPLSDTSSCISSFHYL